ncbi:MAG TPA: hypothetical protein ENI17_03735 [Pseudomonas xinjiangensis]|uniref:Cation/multidrug efflux pump n=2 Tax=root TaxID=1 RepID=A0A7V1BQD3_9GAMM|nr:hypothetical protein [Halopseudomonas xinjiangensis]HEC46718.1 hypothetical protein [Halopseudomonas xinjiangensis]
MQYYGLAALMVGLALLLVVLVLRFGWRMDWLLGWLKGCCLMLMVGFGVALIFAAWDLQQFKSVETALPVAILELEEIGPQRFEASLLVDGVTSRIELEGDLWELNAQVLRWSGFAQALGLADGYRLNKLAGRYLALEQQRDRSLTAVSTLHETPRWRDFWCWLDQLNNPMLVEADAFSLRFMPMVQGARFAVEIGSTGLTPIPLNPVAAKALKRFE